MLESELYSDYRESGLLLYLRLRVSSGHRFQAETDGLGRIDRHNRQCFDCNDLAGIRLHFIHAVRGLTMAFMEREIIPRHDNDPYLDRLTIYKNRWFGAFLHKFLAPDDECLHDHPWGFVSFIISGGYWEIVKHEDDGVTYYTRKWHGPFSLLFRRATHTHRVELEPGRTPITFVIVGDKVRNWGFHTSFGWLPWHKYKYKVHCPS